MGCYIGVMSSNPSLATYFCRYNSLPNYTVYCFNIARLYVDVFYCNILFFPIGIIWATSRENLTLLHADNKGTDQSVHVHSLISTFVIHSLQSMLSTPALYEKLQLSR